MTVLNGQRAVVVGGGSGIGLGSARLLARDGADVLIAGRSADKLAAAAKGLAAEGLTVRWRACDALVAADVRATVAEAGVRVNAIRTGYTMTPSTARSAGNQPLMRAMLDQQALPRHGAIEDQAQAVRYLAGPESSWVTGQCLGVDGGHTLRAFPDYRRYVTVPDQFEVAREEQNK